MNQGLPSYVVTDMEASKFKYMSQIRTALISNIFRSLHVKPSKSGEKFYNSLRTFLAGGQCGGIQPGQYSEMECSPKLSVVCSE